MLIGHGRLNWQRKERITDRYGAIHLSETGAENDHVTFPKLINGQRGSLIAIVRETRQSSHCGDTSRGLFPTVSQVGEKHILGSGTLFIESLGSGTDFNENACVGLKPDDGREHAWLDVQSLYKLHEQTVDLYFEPAHQAC